MLSIYLKRSQLIERGKAWFTCQFLSAVGAQDAFARYPRNSTNSNHQFNLNLLFVVKGLGERCECNTSAKSG